MMRSLRSRTKWVESVASFAFALACLMCVAGCARSHGRGGTEPETLASCAVETSGDPATLLMVSVDDEDTLHLWEMDVSGERRLLLSLAGGAYSFGLDPVSPDGRYVAVESYRETRIVDLEAGTEYAVGEGFARQLGVTLLGQPSVRFRGDAHAALVSDPARQDDERFAELDLMTFEFRDLGVGCFQSIRYTRDATCRLIRTHGYCIEDPEVSVSFPEVMGRGETSFVPLDHDVVYYLPSAQGAVVQDISDEPPTYALVETGEGRQRVLDESFGYASDLTYDGELGMGWSDSTARILNFRTGESLGLDACDSVSARLSLQGDRASCSTTSSLYGRDGIEIVSLERESGGTVRLGNRVALELNDADIQHAREFDLFSRDGAFYLVGDQLSAEEREPLNETSIPIGATQAQYALYATSDGRLIHSIPLRTEFGITMQATFRYPGYRP